MMMGFSPTKFMLPEGSYQVGAANYQNFIFDRWQDGETAPYIASPSRIPASLSSLLCTETSWQTCGWKAFDSVGNSIKGMHISVARDRSVVADGQTPLHLKLPPGSYSMTQPHCHLLGIMSLPAGTTAQRARTREALRRTLGSQLTMAA